MQEKTPELRSETSFDGDSETTVGMLREMVSGFVAEREWEKFHSPKNISMALAVEASELMEHFQWSTIQESRDIAQDEAKLSAVGEELADVLCYGMALANTLGIDISKTMADKMQKNREKYPVEKYLGRFE